VKSNDDSRAEHKAISCRQSDYFVFKLSENGSVLSAENVYCMTSLVINLSHITDLTLRFTTCNVHMTAHPIHVFVFLTKINY